MISILSYIIAVLITVALAVVLYPVAAFFWVLGLFGKLADGIFTLTKKMIKAMWADVRKMEPIQSSSSMEPVNIHDQPMLSQTVETWLCKCGCVNTSKFCAECGLIRPDLVKKENV